MPFSDILLVLLLAWSVEGVLRSFGAGRSQIDITAETEFVLLSHTIASDSSHGAITFFWITGDPIGKGPSSGVDVAIWRFYVDGEAVASVGPFQTAQGALIGDNDPKAQWDNEYFGKNSLFGGWHFNILVPFTKSIRVTLQMPPNIAHQRAFAMARGVEDIPLLVGGLPLPLSARLHVAVRTSLALPVLDFHELVNIPNGSGLLLATMIDLSSADGGSLNSLEGCWHAYMPPSAAFPGLLLGTGAEDYPESAFYFNSGPYRGPTSGLSVMRPGNANTPSRVSFYKIHYRDPIFFDSGIRFVWRNGDVTDPHSGEKCITMNGDIIGKPGVSNVSTLVYVYTW